jgi:cell division protein FtsL
MTKLRKTKYTAPTGHASGANRWLKRIASAVGAMTLVLAAATLVTANNLATAGKGSQDVDREISALQVENSNLKSENAALTSISRIYQAALAAGFTYPKVVENIAKVPSVALRSR